MSKVYFTAINDETWISTCKTYKIKKTRGHMNLDRFPKYVLYCSDIFCKGDFKSPGELRIYLDTMLNKIAGKEKHVLS
jgi:hypothetical protein